MWTDKNQAISTLNRIGWTRSIFYSQHMGTWYPTSEEKGKIEDSIATLGNDTKLLQHVGRDLVADNNRHYQR